MPALDRFWYYVVKNKTGCWGWKGPKHGYGYGVLSVDGKLSLAHRFSYKLHFGSVPKGMHILHKCDNPSCTNPEHLFPGTDADNIKDKVLKGRQTKGEGVVVGKLTPGKVEKIRKLYNRNSKYNQKYLAKMFGVNQSDISRIIHNKYWKHLFA